MLSNKSYRADTKIKQSSTYILHKSAKHEIEAYLSQHRPRDLLISQRKQVNCIGLDCLLKTCIQTSCKTKHTVHKHTKERYKVASIKTVGAMLITDLVTKAQQVKLPLFLELNEEHDTVHKSTTTTTHNYQCKHVWAQAHLHDRFSPSTCIYIE
jgi:hypothetical protein